MMCDAGFDLNQALECSDGFGVEPEINPQRPFKREGSLCDLHSGIKLEVTLHPHNMRQVANLIITMHRIKNNQRLKGTEFSDQELLNIMLESVVEECVVRDVADQTQSSDTVFTSTNRMEECNVCDQYQKSLVLNKEGLELQAMWLQGGTFSHRVRLNLSTYVSPSLPGGYAQPVALGIAGTNLYLSCAVKQETPILQLEEVSSSSKLKIISAQADMARFLFFKRGSALTMTSFESAKYNGWYVSTALEDGERVDMCTTQDSSRLTSFMVKQIWVEKRNSLEYIYWIVSREKASARRILSGKISGCSGLRYSMTDNKCISSCVECVLETDDGRRVFLGADYAIKLFEAQQMDKRHKIQVYRAFAEDRSVHMAFHIQMSGKCFLLTVKDGSLKAQQVTRCFPIEDKQFFFRWGGEYGDARTLLWMGQSGSVVQSGGLPTLFKMVRLSEAK